MKKMSLCSCGHRADGHFKINGKCSRFVGLRPCPCGGFEHARVRRGTSNSNARGNSEDRARRKLYLLTTYESDQGLGTARCYRCGKVLTADTVTIDRIIPGARGGRYIRSNIRPACAKCNSETGGAVRG